MHIIEGGDVEGENKKKIIKKVEVKFVDIVSTNQ